MALHGSLRKLSHRNRGLIGVVEISETRGYLIRVKLTFLSSDIPAAKQTTSTFLERLISHRDGVDAVLLQSSEVFGGIFQSRVDGLLCEP
ncbi:hypothetical protein CDAR_63641 [Caerostris darwini]|uniref:Uncharacterized protein n=1 Tax=Caerostris darwini TaxID=1538125 RepID=A0AAV4QKS4_9ARAC|nr:hypothetical protein CDAR_63641 [Caerostris darwini]